MDKVTLFYFEVEELYMNLKKRVKYKYINLYCSRGLIAGNKE